MAIAKSKLALPLIAAVLAGTALAQASGAAGGAAVVSEPGKAAAARAAEVSAQVVGIDKATRTLKLKGPKASRRRRRATTSSLRPDQGRRLVVARYVSR